MSRLEVTYYSKSNRLSLEDDVFMFLEMSKPTTEITNSHKCWDKSLLMNWSSNAVFPIFDSPSIAIL